MSLPLSLVEKLDQITTYKGKSRSRYIAGAVSQRLEARKVDNMDQLPITYLTSMLLTHEDCPDYLRAMIEFYNSNIIS